MAVPQIKSKLMSRPIVVKTARLTIYSSRPSISTTALRPQRRQTKNFVTPALTSAATAIPAKPNQVNGQGSGANTKAASKAVAPKLTPTVTSTPAQTPTGAAVAATSIIDNKFVKPSSIPKIMSVRRGSSADATSLKCKYCDRTFAKSHALNVHLSENCEKIPASHRRLLSKDTDDTVNSKQVSVGKLNAKRSNNNFKHSARLDRFIDAITNEAASDLSVAQSMNSGSGAFDLTQIKNEIKKFTNKSTGHSGIIRTPTKAMRCRICKAIFYNCVEFAEHCTDHQMAATSSTIKNSTENA